LPNVARLVDAALPDIFIASISRAVRLTTVLKAKAARFRAPQKNACIQRRTRAFARRATPSQRGAVHL
jgi:hypothetical protein